VFIRSFTAKKTLTGIATQKSSRITIFTNSALDKIPMKKRQG